MTPREQHNAAALETLLPLLEAHLDLHGRTVSRAQWVSAPDAARPPQIPEPDCEGRCPTCGDFRTRRCHLREERWTAEWERLRGRYPELVVLEEEVRALGAEHPQYASALYWVHVQPWDAWNPAKRGAWADAGIAWLAERVEGWLPVYVPEGVPTKRKEGPKDVLIREMRIDGLSYHAIAKELRCSKSTVSAVLRGKEVRQGRILNAEGGP